MSIPVLFTSENTLYKYDSAFDCYGVDRNALTWSGSKPAIYHPPCRLFSKMKAFSSAGKCEKLFGYWSIMSVRKFGGIVEHPKSSDLWKEMECDLTGNVDKYGGFLISVNLNWFGFPAKKETLIYIVGCSRSDLPVCPYTLDAPLYMIGTQRKNGKPELNKNLRSQTPFLMIDWFKEIIKGINSPSNLL